MYTRASASDYDDFQAKGWTTKELLPLMRKHETYQRACHNKLVHHAYLGLHETKKLTKTGNSTDLRGRLKCPSAISK